MKEIVIRRVFGGGHTLQIGCTITGAYGPGQEGMLTDHILRYMRDPEGREKEYNDWRYGRDSEVPQLTSSARLRERTFLHPQSETDKCAQEERPQTST